MSLDSVKNTILQTINGRPSVRMIAINAKQEASRKITAEAKNMDNVIKTVIPTETKLLAQLAELEAQKVAKEAEKEVVDMALASADSIMATKREALALAQDIRDMHREALQARRAKAKSQNTEVPPDGPTQEDEAVDTLAKEVKGLDKKYSDLRTKQAILTTEINTIDSEIKSIQNSISSINAQKNPDAALGEAKKNTEQAQQRLNGASTPKEHKEAQQQLTAAQEKEQEIQSISDDSKKAVDNIMTEQEPKYLQLRAEMQTMEMGTRLLDYMITSMTTKASTPSVVGSASPNPAYMTLDNNINYGLMYFILYTCKASSIRFLALAQEIGYEPTSEMSIIASITEYETKMAGFGAMAPGSVQLNV